MALTLAIHRDHRAGGLRLRRGRLRPLVDHRVPVGSLIRNRPQAQEKPAIRERIEQALDPLSKALPLSADDSNRTRAWMIQAGYREQRHITIYQGIRVLFAAVGSISVVMVSENR